MIWSSSWAFCYSFLTFWCPKTLDVSVIMVRLLLGTRHSLFKKSSCLQARRTLLHSRTDQVRKAYETATACPAGRFERGLIRITRKKGNGGITNVYHY